MLTQEEVNRLAVQIAERARLDLQEDWMFEDMIHSIVLEVLDVVSSGYKHQMG